MATVSHPNPLTFTTPDAAAFEETSPLRVASNTVHVWSFALDAPRDVQLQCGQWLSPAEMERAQRFKFDRDRNHFLVAHGCLRHILGRYCHVRPADLAFDRHDGGKPFLRGQSIRDGEVTFNLSHSHGRGMIAVSSGLHVGIDLERIRQDVEHAHLAKRFFSPSEWRTIVASDNQLSLFFRHWVGKESMLKAKGMGLQFPLDRCELVFSKQEDEALVYWREGSDMAQAWRIRFLPLESGWVGAVAAEGTDWTVTSCGPLGPDV